MANVHTSQLALAWQLMVDSKKREVTAAIPASRKCMDMLEVSKIAGKDAWRERLETYAYANTPLAWS